MHAFSSVAKNFLAFGASELLLVGVLQQLLLFNDVHFKILIFNGDDKLIKLNFLREELFPQGTTRSPPTNNDLTNTTAHNNFITCLYIDCRVMRNRLIIAENEICGTWMLRDFDGPPYSLSLFSFFSFFFFGVYLRF